MPRFEVIIILVVLPLAANASLASSAFFGHPAEFSANPEACRSVVTIAILISLVAIGGLKAHDLGPKPAFYAVLGQGLTLIFVFAGVYRGYGLLYSGSALPVPLLNDGESALYFSIVTWTTLGYGDFTPPPELRLIAAAEALVGYLFFGLAVGLGTFLLCEKRPRVTIGD
jgi:Ion channel